MPHAEEMKMLEGQIVIGWNLFVLGSYQMYLGRNYHTDIMRTVNDIKCGNYTQPNRPTEYGVTPIKIIRFIIRVLGKHLDGYTQWIEPHHNVSSMLGSSILGIGNNYSFGMPNDISR